MKLEPVVSIVATTRNEERALLKLCCGASERKPTLLFRSSQLDKVQQSMKPFSISFVIPTLNNEQKLGDCLRAIRRQQYLPELVEIVVSDGGSRDRTLEIAKTFGAKVVNNPRRLAEPGVDLGLQCAENEIRTILAADNVLVGVDWIEKITKPFFDPTVIAAFPLQSNTPQDNWLTRYCNTFTDPANHFIYGDGANTRTFHRVYPVLEHGDEYVIYDFTLSNHPILALAQGFTVRREFQRPSDSEYDDMLPILYLIAHQAKIAYVPSASIEHHTISNLPHFFRKQRWAAANALTAKPYGIAGRSRYLSIGRTIRKYIWLPYVFSIVLPVLNSLRGALADKEFVWLYHPIVSLISATAVLTEFVRIKILHQAKVPIRA